jgi:hypothetical protein
MSLPGNKSMLAELLLLAFLLVCTTSSPAVAADRHSDEFLTGYLASILERDLHWDRDSYALQVREGIATITLSGSDPAGRDQNVDYLRQVEELQGVNIVLKSLETPAPSALAKRLAISSESILFPTGDLFSPLLADPKQPQFFVSYRRYDTPVDTVNSAAVAFGETFGLYRRLGNQVDDGLQFSVAGAIFAQFNMDAPSHDLVNADYTIGFPLTYRRGPTSLRLRIYHQSSHLGDEFLLDVRPERINLSYEAIELVLSRDWQNWRGYAGGEYLFHREPDDLKPASAHAGLEYRGPTEILKLGRFLGAIDLKSFEEHGWSVDTSLKLGLEFGPPDPGRRRLRLMAEGFNGFAPHGQFYDARISYYGLGLYFGF